MSQKSLPVPIVFCITELDPGGAERALFQIVKRLDRRLWSPTILVISGEGEVASWFRHENIPVICLHAKHRFDISTFWRLVQILKTIKPRIIQTFLFHANILGRLAACLARVPFCISGIRVAERRSFMYLAIDQWTEHLVTKHVCVSKGVKLFSQEYAGLDSHKLIVIPNGVDLELFRDVTPIERSQLNLLSDDIVALSVGRLDHQKGYDVLLGALHSWKNMPSNFKLLIAGTGPKRAELEKLIQRYDLQDTVQLLGYRSDVPALLAMADMYVQTSRYEGMCNAILEALAAGKPVITTHIEGVEELKEHSDLSSQVNIVDHQGICAAIMRLYDENNLKKVVPHESQVFIPYGFTWDCVSLKYSNFYLSLLANY